ncbi:MAG: hypothetical protein QME65_02490 [Candidatus Omnitrophota bacterium]|nr:hypothetical protein [Candidatus Omnitrophota bacterium]
MNGKFMRVLFINIAVILGGYFFNIESAFSATRPEHYQELIDMSKQQEVAVAPLSDIVRPAVEYEAEDFRDPFQKPSVESKTVVGKEESYSESEQRAAEFLNSLQVQGIILGGRFPQAIVNNNVIKVGDRVGEARIIGITKAGISIFLYNRIYNISSPAGSGPDLPKQGGSQ